MSNRWWYTVSMKGDAILSVQPCELREVTELRWDSAIELIRVEGPERATKWRNENNGRYIINTYLIKNFVIHKDAIRWKMRECSLYGLTPSSDRVFVYNNFLYNNIINSDIIISKRCQIKDSLDECQNGDILIHSVNGGRCDSERTVHPAS